MMEASRLKIVFFGTPEFASAQLEAVLQAGFQVVAVVTAPDKPAGRGRHMQASAVKLSALNNGIQVLQPLSLKDEFFISTLRGLAADVFVVVAFRMLPEIVWAMPKKGTFNLHASLLPDYRGAAPINRAIMNGETISGLTTFFIDAQIDSGAIILQKKLEIHDTETAGTLHDRMMHEGRSLVVETLNMIAEDRAISKPQEVASGNKTLHTAPKIFRDDCRIDWNSPPQTIYNHIRGLSPYPGAFTSLQSATGTSTELKILSASLIKESCNAPARSFCFPDKNRVLVCLKDCSLELNEVQGAGKKPMKAADFFRGLRNDGSWYAT
jgi:methionyl-tRNA formyltransferase